MYFRFLQQSFVLLFLCLSLRFQVYHQNLLKNLVVLIPYLTLLVWFGVEFQQGYLSRLIQEGTIEIFMM